MTRRSKPRARLQIGHSPPRSVPRSPSDTAIQQRLVSTVKPTTLSSIDASLIPIDGSPAGDSVEVEISFLTQEIHSITSRIQDRIAHAVKLALEYSAKWNPHLSASDASNVSPVRGLVRNISDESTEPIAARPWATTTLRARVQRVWGARPRATFMSKSEGRAFHLNLTKEQATALGKHLYSTVDIVARVGRDNAGYIEDGTLIGFYPVAGPNARTTWTVLNEWFKHSGVQSLDELEENRTDDDEDGGGGRGDR